MIGLMQCARELWDVTLCYPKLGKALSLVTISTFVNLVIDFLSILGHLKN